MPATAANDGRLKSTSISAYIGNFALRLAVDVALALHLSAAAFWWWFSPKGFPIASSQFWTNSVLPVAVMALASIGLIAMHKGHCLVAAATVLCFAGAWATAAIASRIVFPLSLAGVWLLFLVVACAGGALFALLVRGERKLFPTWMACAAIGVAAGLLVVRWQIPEPPSTIPWSDSLSRETDVDDREELPSRLDIAEDAKFNPSVALLTVRRGNIRINCSPLLEFHRISPDHFWSLLARRGATPIRHYVKQTSIGEEHTIHYSDGSTIRLPRQTADAALELTAFTPLATATYSHLNTFCYVEIGGHQSLAVSF